MLTPIRNYLKKRQLARASTSTPTPTPTPSTATSTTTNITTNATCRKLQKAKILKTEPSCTLEPRPRKILFLVKQYEVNLKILKTLTPAKPNLKLLVGKEPANQMQH